jgi:hypothetical protein
MSVFSDSAFFEYVYDEGKMTSVRTITEAAVKLIEKNFLCFRLQERIII